MNIVMADRFTIVGDGTLTLPDGSWGPVRYSLEANSDLGTSIGSISSENGKIIQDAVQTGFAQLVFAPGMWFRVSVNAIRERHAWIAIVGHDFQSPADFCVERNEVRDPRKKVRLGPQH